MTYNPRDYWSKRFRAQGPTYVSPTRDGSAAQADALWFALEPYLRSEDTALDYGCGTGRLAPRIADRVRLYRGVDINAPALEYAREAHPRLKFLQIDEFGAIPLAHCSTSLVVAVTVLQHVPESVIAATCAEVNRVLARDGRVVLIEDANPERKRPAAHMAFRSADRYAELLGMRVVAPPVVFDAERPSSHYVVELGS